MTPTGHVRFRCAEFQLETNQGPKVLESSLARGPLQCQSEHYNTQHGPTALRWWPRRDGESRSVEVEPCLLLGGGRAGCAAGPACGSLAEGRSCLIRGRFCLLGMAPGRRRGGRARRRSLALPVGAGAYVEVGPSGRLVSRRGSGVQARFASHERMELNEAVKKQDVETVEVRRPLEAGSSTECCPSRGICLGSVDGPSMPSSHARFGLAVSNQALTSGTSQASLMMHAGARPCRSGRQVP
jgi:hypothetical protein